jgi:diamine N-acetyltransferase
MSQVEIRLRPLEPTDIDFVLQIENNEANWSVSNTYIPFSRFAVEQYVLNPDQDIFSSGQLRMIIEDKATQSLLGCVDLFEYDPRSRRAGVGIIIQPEYQQQGYASAAISAMIHLAFDSLGMHQLSCLIHPENVASIKLFRKHGFVQSGVKKDWAFYEGAFHDLNFYQLINSKKQF